MQCRPWLNVTRDQKCLCLVVSLKHSLALMAVLSVGRTDYHTAHLCLSASLSNKNTPSQDSFAHTHGGSHISKHVRTDTRTIIEVRRWHGGMMEILLKHIATSFPLWLATFMYLLYISAGTINSILRQHVHTHTHTGIESHNEFRGGVSPCQSQEESCMLLQIRDNAGASPCVELVCVLWERNCKYVLPSLLCKGIFALGR